MDSPVLTNFHEAKAFAAWKTLKEEEVGEADRRDVIGCFPPAHVGGDKLERRRHRRRSPTLGSCSRELALGLCFFMFVPVLFLACSPGMPSTKVGETHCDLRKTTSTLVPAFFAIHTAEAVSMVWLAVDARVLLAAAAV